IDQNTGWISGDSGIVIKTTNSGTSFTVFNTGITEKIESFHFVNNTTGWAAALVSKPDSTNFSGTIILKTTDGGINWSNYMYPDTNVFLPVIYFTDSLNGYLGGFGSTILYTSNAGVSWVKAFTDSASIFYPVLSIKFYDNLTGFACGGFFDLAGVVWKTTDGGRIWHREIIGGEPFADMCILNSNNVFLTGGDFKFGVSISKTINNGINWQTKFLGIFGVGTSIDFRTPYEGWISLGFASKFIYSLDTGNTWTEIYTPDTTKINDIQFIDSLNGWAVGDQGTILKYNSLTSIYNSHSEIIDSKSFTLFQNYPNPFNPVTVIRYEIPSNVKPRVPSGSTSNVRLTVYNSLGKEVAALVNEKQNPGIYYVEFDGSNLSSGIYFYRLEAGDFIEAKRMVLLK
ncbi:MAG: T9SS type A sorting domain-containing protein, partial [bacterium]